MFLDTLSRFIQDHREYLDDWLFILLLRLLQRAGTDMLSSVLFKLQMVLEHVRLVVYGCVWSSVLKVSSLSAKPLTPRPSSLPSVESSQIPHKLSIIK